MKKTFKRIYCKIVYKLLVFNIIIFRHSYIIYLNMLRFLKEINFFKKFNLIGAGSSQCLKGFWVGQY